MVKLKDVAASANVSIATASKVLGGGVETERISEGARQRVLDACAELGYRPNYMARSLQSGRAYAVGSLMGYEKRAHTLGLLWWGLINGGMLEATSHRQYQLVTIGGGGATPSIERAMQALQEGRIDALVMPGYLSWSPLIAKMVELRLPAVMTLGNESCDLPTVEVDDLLGVTLAVEHLHALGHRRLLWTAFERNENSPEARREIAFLEAAHALQIETEVLRLPLPAQPWFPNPETEIEAARAIFIESWSRARPRATGVIAFNEVLALGLYAAAQHLKISIPRDLSVVGFDDLLAHAAYPAMTVVSLMLHEIGARSVELALEVAAKPDDWSHWLNHRERIEPKLVVRQSTAPPSR